MGETGIRNESGTLVCVGLKMEMHRTSLRTNPSPDPFDLCIAHDGHATDTRRRVNAVELPNSTTNHDPENYLLSVCTSGFPKYVRSDSSIPFLRLSARSAAVASRMPEFEVVVTWELLLARSVNLP